MNGLRRHYPELNDHKLVNVDILDDGETLSTVRNGSQEFIIANHFLEHCENPLGTVRNHLRKLRPGGVLYYAVPDKRFTFDHQRPVTAFDHLVLDDRWGPATSRRAHFEEWVRLVNNRDDAQEVEKEVEQLMKMNYSIHCHVWNEDAFRDFLTRCRNYLSRSFDITEIQGNGSEIIAILRKT